MGKIVGAPATSNRINPRSMSDWGANAFVWGIWTSMFLAALAFVARDGRNVPFWDDWTMIEWLTGRRPVDAEWLWKEYHEHRIPLPKLILVTLGRATDCDFRAGMIFSTCVLAALAGAMIWTARCLRGRTSYADAFFPLALLHWGHWASLLWAALVHFTSALVLTGLLLVCVVRGGCRLTLGTAAMAGVCLILLPLTGGVGLPYVPPLALWLIYISYLQLRSRTHGDRIVGFVALGLTSAALLLTACYFVGLETGSLTPGSRSPRATLRTAAQFLSTGLGPISISFWPLSGLAVLGLLGIGVANMAVVWRTRNRERPRVLGLLLFAGGIMAFALGLGWGRAGLSGSRGFSPHYVSSATMALCCVYFMFGLGAMPGNHLAQAGLCVLMALLLPFNVRDGLVNGGMRRERMAGFQRDVSAGVPPLLLADRHAPFLIPYERQERVAEWLRMLHDAGVGPYRSLREDPPAREVPLATVPTGLGRMRGDGCPGRDLGGDRWLIFDLRGPRFAYGIRLEYDYEDASGHPAYARLSWERDDRKDGPIFLGKSIQFNSWYQGGGETWPQLEIKAGRHSEFVPIYTKIDRFGIALDQDDPRFSIRKITISMPTTIPGGEVVEGPGGPAVIARVSGPLELTCARRTGCP